MKPSLLIGAIGLALTGFLGYHALYAPQHGKASVIRTQLAQERANQSAQAEVAGLLKDVNQYRKRLPASPEPSWLVRETASIANKVGLELRTITQEGPQVYPQFTRLAIEIDFDATFHELGAFLDQLERSEHYIRVENVNVSNGVQQGGKASMHVILSTLYVPPVAGGAGTASAAAPN